MAGLSAVGMYFLPQVSGSLYGTTMINKFNLKVEPQVANRDRFFDPFIREFRESKFMLKFFLPFSLFFGFLNQGRFKFWN